MILNLSCYFSDIRNGVACGTISTPIVAAWPGAPSDIPGWTIGKQAAQAAPTSSGV